MSSAPRIVDVVPRVAATSDAAAVRTLKCAGRTPRYGNTAQRLIRRCGSVLAGTVAVPSRFRCLLFEDRAAEAEDRLVGISAVAKLDDGICDWIVMGIARPFHGGRVPDGRSLATAIAEQTAQFARDQGYKRMVAQVHRGNQKPLHIIGQLGFVVVTSLDVDYSLYAVDLT